MVGSILTVETGHDHRKGVVESEHLVREKTEGYYFAIEAVEMRALLAALEARDGYTGEHSKTVMGLAVEVACRMRLPEEELRVVGDVEGYQRSGARREESSLPAHRALTRRRTGAT